MLAGILAVPAMVPLLCLLLPRVVIRAVGVLSVPLSALPTLLARLLTLVALATSHYMGYALTLVITSKISLTLSVALMLAAETIQYEINEIIKTTLYDTLMATVG